MFGEFLKPRCPTRKEVLETVGDQGRKHWRNPVHLAAVHDKWPQPETKEARVDHREFGLEEGGPSHNNGSIA